VNTEPQQYDDSQYSYPTGYVLKQDIHSYQLGSFVKLIAQKQPVKKDDKKETLNKEVSLNYMNSKKY
jgi:hypothetical protein